MLAGYTDPYGKEIHEMWLMRINNEALSSQISDPSLRINVNISIPLDTNVLVVNAKKHDELLFNK